MNILIVHEEPWQKVLLQTIGELRKTDRNLEVHSTPFDAILRLPPRKEFLPDLILVGWHIRGKETLDRVRYRFPDCPIWVLSSLNPRNLYQDASEANLILGDGLVTPTILLALIRTKAVVVEAGKALIGFLLEPDEAFPIRSKGGEAR